MKKTVGILIAAAAVAAAAAGTYFINEHNNNIVALTDYEFESAEIPQEFDGFTVMVISDLHNAPFSEQIAEYIKNEQPDITVFTGDMVQLPDSDLSECRAIVEAADGLTEFYGVTGNHEMQNEKLWQIVEELEDMGVCMVESRDESIKIGDAEINLAGLADPGMNIIDKDDGEEICETAEKILGNNEDMFNILLCHRSVLYPYIKDSGADLIISGDLHGGIIRLPFIGGIIGGDGLIDLPEYEYGFIKEGESAAMIVSGGCDKNPRKKRFFNQPEVLMITLKAKQV